MRYIFLLLLFISASAMAQQKERTISITCYANPELYMDAGVIAHVSDKAGNISCRGNYVAIANKSSNTFYYQDSDHWIPVEPQGKAIVFLPGASSSAKSPSVVKLSIRYTTDLSGNITSKIRTIDELNAQSDQVKARELEGVTSKASSSVKVSGASTTRSNSSPQASTVQKTTTKTQSPKPETKTTIAKTKTPTQQTRPATGKKQTVARTKPKTTRTSTSGTRGQANGRTKYAGSAKANALGLRVDFGDEATGVGPNFKHQFNRTLALDAALVFYNGNFASLGAQLEKSFAVSPSDPGLSMYLGVGPQLWFDEDETALAIVPVGGLEYNIPTTPLNLSIDWRPNFFLSPAGHTETARFGFSFRVKF